MATADVLVVGGGIAGLAVATHLQRADVDVAVLEASSRVGGKVAGADVAGLRIDVGTDAWLERDDAMRELVEYAGLFDQVIEPATTGVWLWTRSGLVPMPSRTVLGVPTDPSTLREALGDAAAERAAEEPDLPATDLGVDISVGAFVRERFGDEVATELVDPLLGGVYAGHVDELSLRATLGPVVEAAPDGRDVMRQLRARPSTSTPVFRSLRDGLHQLPAALGAQLRERLRTAAHVTELRRQGDVWAVTTSDSRRADATRLVVAVPAPVVASLLQPFDEEAASIASAIRHASVGVVALAYPSEQASRLPEGTGMLVPRSAGRFIKASTWVSAKWGRPLDREPLLVRASVGRIDDERFAGTSDDDVAGRTAAELEEALGLEDPVAVHVERWAASLPQYDVGHLERVARLRDRLADVAPGLHLVGAAWDGVGIGPIATAARALARQIVG